MFNPLKDKYADRTQRIFNFRCNSEENSETNDFPIALFVC